MKMRFLACLSLVVEKCRVWVGGFVYAHVNLLENGASSETRKSRAVGLVIILCC